MTAPKEDFRRLDIPDPSWSHEAEIQHWNEKLKDPKLLRAYQLFLAAWKIVESGDGDATKAMALMQEAADIDSDYRNKLEYFGECLDRKARSGAGERLLALEDLRARKLISDEEFFNRQGDILLEIT